MAVPTVRYTSITHWIKGGVVVQCPSRNENGKQFIQFAFGHFTDRPILGTIIFSRRDKRPDFMVVTPVSLCLIQSESLRLQDKFTALKVHLAFCKILCLFYGVLYKTFPEFSSSVVPKPPSRITPVFCGPSQSAPLSNRSDGNPSPFRSNNKDSIQHLLHFTRFLATLCTEVVRLTGSL